VDQVAGVVTPTGFTLSRASLHTATALDADGFNSATVTPLAAGGWALPKMSLLVLEFGAS